MKKALSLLIALATLLTTLVVVPMTAHAGETIVTEQTPAPGSAEYTQKLMSDGYVGIDDFAQITAFTADSKYFMKQDITIPATYSDALIADEFYGVLDGNGHTVYNGKYNIFSKFGGTMKNIIFSEYKDATKSDIYDTTAALLGTILDGAVVENVTSYRTFADVANYWGCWSRAVKAGVTATFKGCVNYSNISSPYPVNNHKLGCFVGVAEANSTIIFEDCVNNGNATGSQVGGFVGTINANVNLTFKNCTNNGTIAGLIGKSSGEGSYGVAGGLIGGYNNVKAREGDVTIYVEGCVNNGNVIRQNKNNPSTKTTRVTSGGLIGNVGLGTSSYKLTLTIKDCTVANCLVGGSTSWQDVVDSTTQKVTTDYTQGNVGGIMGWLGTINAEDVITIEGITINNAVIESGDPDYATIFLNTEPNAPAVKLKNVYAVSCGNIAVGTGKFTIEDNGSATEVTINKTQATAAAQNLMSLRFLGSVSGLNYLNLGFMIEATVDGAATYTCVSNKNVYNEVNNGAGKLAKTDFGGNYITAAILGDVPADKTVTYKVTPYAINENGELLVGAAKTVTLTNGALS